MDGLLRPEVFLDIWNSSASPTEVAVRLWQAGYRSMDPDECKVIAAGYALSGYDVNAMILPDLPRFEDPDADLAPPRSMMAPVGPDPGLTAPATVVECEVAAKHAAFERAQRDADPAFTGWYMNERWAFKPGSND